MDDPLRMTDPEVQERLRSLQTTGAIIGWSRSGGRYIVRYTEVTDPEDEPSQPTAVMTGPQTRAFLCGIDAGMGWVTVVARQIRDAEALS